MKLVIAEGHPLAQVLEASHEIWSDGLTAAAYRSYNAAQLRTPWGVRHLRRYALIDESGAVLSSAKRYGLRARVEGRDVDVVGIGAVYTPPGMRRRGHARAIVEQIVAAAAAEGA